MPRARVPQHISRAKQSESIMHALHKKKRKEKILIGWKEHVSIPGLNIQKITAKVDTGAYTSCLHATAIKPFTQEGQVYVSFVTHPLQFDDSIEVECVAPIVDYRLVRSSNGQHEKRFVIETPVWIGQHHFTAELTLTDRSGLNFRMLLGRGLLSGHFLVDVRKSFCQDKFQVPL